MTDAAAAPAGEAEERIPSGATLLAWAAGGAALTGCVDLLVAILLGLDGSRVRGADFRMQDLALPVAAMGLAGFAAAAGSLGARSRSLAMGAAFHVLVAGGGWWWLGEKMGDRVPVLLLGALGLHGVLGAAALAGLFAERGSDPDARAGRRAHAAAAVNENLESVLVAIVFALVIRHFAVEAYKIPTASMEPTLLGDNDRRGPGDRVLVKKWPALLRGPERYEVWVFRPPLDRTINYVKRVGGLPGETVEIDDGDLYVGGAISRKPPLTREEMWYAVWPDPFGTAAPESPWAGEGFRKDGEDGFRVEGATERRLLRYDRPIRDAVYGRSGSNLVGDVRVRFDVENAEPGTGIVVRIIGRGGPVEMRLAADGMEGGSKVGGSEGILVDPPREPIRSLEVSFADLWFEMIANGKRIAGGPVDPLPYGERPSYSVAFGVEKGGATFRDVRLDRDVFYDDPCRFTVPEGHYFFLGDNSSHSQDSRKWAGWEIRESGSERVFYADERPRALAGKEGRVGFRDRNGVLREFDARDVTTSSGKVPMSFVPKADLHGRAFAIFWPPRWFTKQPGGRVRFLP